MRKLALLIPGFIMLPACTTPATPVALTVESAASPVGDWLDGASWNGAGDIVSAQLLGDGRFARVRCLDDGCSRSVPEDGHWIAHKKTISFYLGAGNANASFTPDPTKLLDSWTFSVTRARLTLTSNGVRHSLAASSDGRLCALSGGTFSAATGSCDCGSGFSFVAGEAGCVPSVTPSESLCDATGGSWTDDDNNLLGTYCECPRDQAWSDGTGCAAP